jgi:hypothetical protein
MSEKAQPLDVLPLLDVYVGYANTSNKGATPPFPNPGSSLLADFPHPWANSHNVIYDGKLGPSFSTLVASE